MRSQEYWDWTLAAAGKDDTPNKPVESEFDPYALASSFYGPGVILAWYLIYISFLIKFAIDTDTRRPGGNVRLSADLIATLSYPAIAGGHLLIRLTEFPAQERRHLLIMLADLAFTAGMSQHGQFASWGGDGSIGPPTVAGFQHAVAVEGPVRVLQNFLFVSTSVIVMVCAKVRSVRPVSWIWGQERWWRHTGPAGWLLFAVYWWSCVVIFATFIAGGRTWVVMSYLFCMSFGQVLVFYWILVLGFGGLQIPCFFVITLLEGNPSCSLLGSLFLVVVLELFFAQFMPWILSAVVVPDTGVGLGELDQVATVLGGAATLIVTALQDMPEGKHFVEYIKRSWLEHMQKRRKRGLQEETGDADPSGLMEVLPLHVVDGREHGQLGRVSTV